MRLILVEFTRLQGLEVLRGPEAVGNALCDSPTDGLPVAECPCSNLVARHLNTSKVVFGFNQNLKTILLCI